MLENRWLLPEGIEELLPEEAARVETLRRRLLDTYAAWGYELVLPPLIEYLESLLVGTGRDLDLQTFKLIDQLSGRMMGVRADITPQVARIDAHRLRRECPTRLCYVGSVIHTLPDEFGGERSPLQIGAEIYGHAGIASDLEIVSLAMETLRSAGLTAASLDLGHVGVYRGLAAHAGLADDQDRRMFELVQRKGQPEIEAFVRDLGLPDSTAAMFVGLPLLAGDPTVLERARAELAPLGPKVGQAIEELTRLVEGLQRRDPHCELRCDLSEIRGYHYETGVVFAAYVPGHGQEVARGGRYDAIGKVFGRARPATGFSTDLKLLARLSEAEPVVRRPVFAPADEDPALWQRIRQLRAAGEIVVCGLPGQVGGAAEMGCDRALVRGDHQWVIQEVVE